jgi:hypothetical protein
MASVCTIGKQALLAQLQEGVGVLLEVAEAELRRSSDTESQFSVEIFRNAASLGQILKDLAPYADLFDISLAYRIQNGSGTASLTPKGLLVVNWSIDPDLSPSDLDPESTSLFENLAERLSRSEERIQMDSLARDLALLVEAEASVEVSLRIFLDKVELMKKLEWPQHIRQLLYIVADKFLQEIHDADFSALDALLVPNSEDTVTLMLGDASGVAKGPNIRICGKDHWTTQGDLGFQASEADRKRVQDAINFRSEECHWEIAIPSLTPYHLHIESSSLSRPDIWDTVARLRDRLSVACLADRVQTHDGILKCEFKGHKRVQIAIPPLNGHVDSASVFKLFTWAYENSSSDKLGIVRQVISLQLGDDASDNYYALINAASEILGVAKSNFQLFLRRSVELYFDKRLKVSEFLQKFSQEVSTSVSELTSELVSNLYKTVGVILGVVIAALVDPKQTAFVVFLTSLLYLAYIGFILAYWLPSTLWRFRRKVQDYKHSVFELRDVLSEEEIRRLEGKSFKRTGRMFWAYFIVTGLSYAVLGIVAFLIAACQVVRSFLK